MSFKGMSPDSVQDELNSARPKVLLTGNNRLMYELAAHLGVHLRDKLYFRKEVVRLDEGHPKPVGVQEFRTLVERYVVCCRSRKTENGSIQVGVTMSESEARGVLASAHFAEQLRPLRHVNLVRIPVLRRNGSIELLPDGYDEQTQTFTASEVDYQSDMSLDEARAIFADLFGEFEFADGQRSLSVSVAALVGMGASGLLPEGARSPAFVVTKNCEGAGASTLAACIVSPYHRKVTINSMPNEDAEMGKTLLTALRKGSRYIIFDNIKGRIGGDAIEGFITAPVYSGRLLGAIETVEYPNNVTCVFTANGAAVTPDMRRRSLFIELHLSAERAEDRQFKRPLNERALEALRPQILAAVWSLVRHWDALGRPKPSRSHSAFPEWAETVGGIVENAGYSCPFETPRAVDEVDEDGSAMRGLVTAMQPEKKYTAREIAGLCREIGTWGALVGDSEQDLTASRRSALGMKLKRWDNRQVGEKKFVIEGKNHQRRYRIEAGVAEIQGDKVEQGLPPRVSKNPVKLPLRGNTLSDLATLQTAFTETQEQANGTSIPVQDVRAAI